MTTRRLTTSRPSRRRGSALVAVMWTVIALTAIVLMLTRTIGVEGMAAAHRMAQAKADAAELGVEQFVLSQMTTEQTVPGTIDQTNWEARQVGDCYFWVIKPNPDDENTMAYGLTDEAGKLDLNTATYAMLQLLPNINEEEDVAAAIVDWRDTDSDPTGMDDAEDTYYMSLAPPYHCKNAPFETTEELRLVRGVSDPLLYGSDANRNGTLEQAELDSANTGVNFQTSARGILPCVTVYGVKATNPAAATTTTTTSVNTTAVAAASTAPININDNNQATMASLQQMLQQYIPARATQIINQTRQNQPFQSIWHWAVQMQLTGTEFTSIYDQVTCAVTQTNGQTAATTAQVGKVNIMNAPEAVLYCIPGFDQNDVQAIMTYRQTTATTDYSQKHNLGWLLDVISDKTHLAAQSVQTSAGQWITGTSTIYSADIVTVTTDGRAFKRVRIVVDASSGTPQIVYRRDLSAGGWPLDPAIRAALRGGEGLTGNGSTRTNGLSFGAR